MILSSVRPSVYLSEVFALGAVHVTSSCVGWERVNFGFRENSGFWSVAMDSGFPTVVSAMKIGEITRNHVTWTSLGPIQFVETAD